MAPQKCMLLSALFPFQKVHNTFFLHWITLTLKTRPSKQELAIGIFTECGNKKGGDLFSRRNEVPLSAPILEPEAMLTTPHFSVLPSTQMRSSIQIKEVILHHRSRLPARSERFPISQFPF